MAKLEITIAAVEPFADGRAFGEAGPYLRIRGVAKGELDPKAPENTVIVDLDKAPRDARGLVEYETDFFIMRPADPAGIHPFPRPDRRAAQAGGPGDVQARDRFHNHATGGVNPCRNSPS